MVLNKVRKLNVEDYIDFFNNRAHDLSVAKLRQIIGMHGFRKMTFQKQLAIEIISTMDLMDLRRSTLLDDVVSGDARFAVEEVIKDLKDLNWQECNVTSLVTQGAAVPPPSAAVTGKRKIGGETVPVKRKRGGGAVSVKRKSFKAIGNTATEVGGVGNSVLPAGTLVVAGSIPEVSRSNLKCNSSSTVSAAGTPVSAGSTTDTSRSLVCNSLPAVASSPIKYPEWPQECNITSLLTQGAVAIDPPTAAASVSVKRKGCGSETVSVKQKSGSGIVSVKRAKVKLLKEIGKNSIEEGVGNSVFPYGTLVAGRIPEVLGSFNCNSSSAVSAAGTTFADSGTTDILRSLAGNSLPVVASPPIIPLRTGRQLHPSLKSN